MISLLVRRARNGRVAAALPMHSAAASFTAAAASSLSLCSLLRQCAPTSASVSLRCAAAVSSLTSPLLRYACAATNAATIANQPRRSLHCGRQTRVHAGSDGGSDATSKGQQARQPPSPPRGSPSKNEHPREAQEQRPNDRATHRTRPHGSAPLTGKATTVGPFRFDAQSAQSEEQQRAFHQLAILRYQYTDKFPTKAQHIAGGINDITRKQEWQSMRSEARKLLALLLKLSPPAASAKASLAVAQCESMLHRCQQLRLVEEPLLILRAMLNTGVRASARCCSMLLFCIVHSPEWAAQTGDTAPCGDHSALDALCADRPPPSAELRGVDLAQWMLEGMLSPTLRDRFEVNVVVWNSVLGGLTRSAPSQPDERLQRARAFYERIPNKIPATHNVMLTAYREAGMHADHEALWQLLKADPIASASPVFRSTRLVQIDRELTALQGQAHAVQRKNLLQEIAELWREALNKPAERMDLFTAGSMLKVIARLGDIELMMAVIREAIDAEQDQTLVLVHPACYVLLFDTMSQCADPARWKEQATDAWTQMLQRQVDEQTRNLFNRSNKLRLNEAALSAYMRYLQRTQQRAEIERVWNSAPRHCKEANPLIFLARLKVLATDGDALVAERIIAEMPSFNVQPNAQHFAAWIVCYKKGGLCAEAERVWQRMVDSGVKPESFSYRELMQVYMNDGSPEQLAKIDRLYAEMLQSIPAGMSAGDYQHLIKRAHLCRLPSEARKWSDWAKATGVWRQLDPTSHNIVARIDSWKDLPRHSKTA